MTRRGLLQAGAGAALAGSGYALPKAFAEALNLPSALSEGTRGEALLDALPGKKPLIKLTYRPPNYETPIGLLPKMGSRRTMSSSFAIISSIFRKWTPRPGS